MTSRKRSAWRRQKEQFEAQLADGLDDGWDDGLESAFDRAEAKGHAVDDRREAAFRAKSCESKKRYDTREDAEEAIELCAQHGRRGLTCYRCEFCGGWHLTSHPWK